MLRIDRSFIHALDERAEYFKVVSSVMSLAHALGLKAVAQGVETPRQLMRLRYLGCETARVSYFAEALSHRAILAFIAADLCY